MQWFNYRVNEQSQLVAVFRSTAYGFECLLTGKLIEFDRFYPDYLLNREAFYWRVPITTK